MNAVRVISCVLEFSKAPNLYRKNQPTETTPNIADHIPHPEFLQHRAPQRRVTRGEKRRHRKRTAADRRADSVNRMTPFPFFSRLARPVAAAKAKAKGPRHRRLPSTGTGRAATAAG